MRFVPGSMSVDLLPGRPVSIWRASAEASPRPKLTDFDRYDVAIIGGGIVGITTAFALRNAGMKVALFEAATLLSGVTGNTTGKLTSQHGVIFRHLIDTFGKEKAQRYLNANEWALRWVRETAENQGIRCDFIPEAAHVYTTELSLFPSLQDEFDACVELGMPVSLIEKPDLPFDTAGALRLERQARFHPLKFLSALAELAEQAGIRIFEHSRVFEVEEEETFCRLRTEHGPVLANKVVVATNYPIHDSGFFIAKLSPIRSYAIAVEVEGHMPRGMFITHDKEEPLRSLRRQWFEDRELLILGGESHKVGVPEDQAKCYLNMEHWARMHFDVQRVWFRWSTQDNWTNDGLPYIGLSPNRRRILMATGFFGWGMTNGVVAGRILKDLILGIDNSWVDLFDPSRMGLATVPRMLTEGVSAGARLVADRVKRVPESDFNDIKPGEGAIILLEGERVAVFRDEAAQLHAVSPTCTHMGCQVHFNDAEQTWDCPCHGSRFDVDGNALHGPAVKALEKKALPVEAENGVPYMS